MNRRTILLTLFTLLLVVATVLLAACATQKEPTAPAGGSGEVAPAEGGLDGKALAEERCATCHPYSRIAGTGKSAADWKSTVERMISHGAQLTAAEQAAVIEHLSEAYP